MAVSAFAARGDAADTPTFTLAQRPTVSPMSSPIVSAVAAQAQRSTRAGRILVLDGDPTNGTVNASLWRGSGPSLTDGSPATRALALAQARSGAAEGVLRDPATASLAQAAYTLVVYPDDATVATLAATEAGDGWSQAFEMPSAGHLTLTYSAWWIIPWQIASGACLVVAAASALSAWRKR